MSSMPVRRWLATFSPCLKRRHSCSLNSPIWGHLPRRGDTCFQSAVTPTGFSIEQIVGLFALAPSHTTPGSHGTGRAEAHRLLKSSASQAAPPNKPMQRAGTHKVPGRGRPMSLQSQVRLARVLNRQRAVADGCRWATLPIAHMIATKSLPISPPSVVEAQ
jgi:hypothetical protein